VNGLEAVAPLGPCLGFQVTEDASFGIVIGVILVMESCSETATRRVRRMLRLQLSTPRLLLLLPLLLLLLLLSLRQYFDTGRFSELRTDDAARCT